MDGVARKGEQEEEPMSESVKVPFGRDEARKHLVGRDVWPVDDDAPYAAGVRDWWLRLLEKVTDAVNEHDWHDEAYPGDKYTEFTETAAEQMVAEARKARAVLRILDASAVGDTFDPGHDEVELMLVLPLLEGDGTEGAYWHAGEDASEYAERTARLREECKQRLTLGSVTETYLTAAAVAVARAWCEQTADAWHEANPEPDEDDEDE